MALKLYSPGATTSRKVPKLESQEGLAPLSTDGTPGFGTDSFLLVGRALTVVLTFHAYWDPSTIHDPFNALPSFSKRHRSEYLRFCKKLYWHTIATRSPYLVLLQSTKNSNTVTTNKKNV